MWIVDIDLEKFLDTVSHDKLMTLIGKTFKDGDVISIIRKFLVSWIMADDEYKESVIGTPHKEDHWVLCVGISCWTSWIKNWKEGGHRFVRYADDALIFCKSKKSAERTLENIIPDVEEEELFLKVNRNKTTVTHVSWIKYLGSAFYRSKEKCRFRVHPKTVKKMKDRIREITRKSKGWGNNYRRQKLSEYVRGWINYYKLADMKVLMAETDKWLCRRIRAIYWKQWKKVKVRRVAGTSDS